MSEHILNSEVALQRFIGDVREDWAREHHRKWVEELERGL